MADKPNITINITGANPQIYPSAEQITHNHYYGDQFAEEAIKTNQGGVIPNMEEEEMEDGPLRMFLKDKEDYDYVLEWAKLCKSPKDIYNSIVLPLKKKGYGLDITTTLGFVTALLPYLTNYTASINAESICRALRK